MSEKILRSWALKSLKEGVVPDDGTMGTVLADVGEVVEDSAQLLQDEMPVISQRSEFADFDTDVFSEEGAIKLTYSVVDYSAAGLAAAVGGTETGGWWEKSAHVQREVCVQIIDKKGGLFELRRGHKVGKINKALSKKKGAAVIDVTIYLLQPDNPTVMPMGGGRYKVPVVSAGADATITANNTNLAGTGTAFRGQIVKQAWTCVSKPNAAAPVFGTGTALNTTVTGLTVSGAYTFQLAVTDSNGFTGTDEVTITVNLA